MYSDLVFTVSAITHPEQTHLLRDLYEGLVIFDREGNLQPGVAQQWQTTDNKHWIFVLRPQTKWSNGEALSAHEFVRSWQRLALSDNPLKQYLAFLNLENAEAVLAKEMPVEKLGITALDDDTLQIRLDKSTPYLPKMLAHSALLPQYQPNTIEPQQIEHHQPMDNQSTDNQPTDNQSTDNQSTDNQQTEHKPIPVVGNGAYRLIEQGENRVVLEKNPFYWQTTPIFFEQVNYHKIQNNQPIEQLDLVERPQSKLSQLIYFPQLCMYFYEFNFNDPLLKQSTVRSVLTAMVSVQDIARNEQTMWANSVNFLPQNMQFEQEREWEPTLVEQLLQQSGITDTNPLTLRVTYENSGIHPMVADRLIRAWSQSDLIRIKAEPLSHAQLLEKREQGDFQVIRSGWCADYNDPSAFLNLLYSKSPDNKTAFSNDKIDQLLEKTLSEKISDQERSTLYQQITLAAQQEKAVLPIFQYMKPVYLHSTLSGYDVKNPTEVLYSKDLSRKAEPLKTADTRQ